MAKGTCSQDGCGRDVCARGLCNSHYCALRRAGDLAMVATRAPHHRLSKIDREARTATCALCGHVDIQLRSNGQARCGPARRAEPRHASKRGKVTAEARRRWKYGLTSEQLSALQAAAQGRCGICDVEFGEDFHVDHCHETGLVRGLLCPRCNKGIGWLNDDPAAVLSAYFYLKASGR